MPWINIFDPEMPYEVVYSLADNASLSGGNIVHDGPDGVATWFEVSVVNMSDPLAEVRLQVTNLTYVTVGGKGGLVYEPAKFTVAEEIVQVNEASPYPASTFPAGDGSVTEWAPVPFEIVGSDGSASLRYDNATYTSDGLRLGEQWSFLIEVWIDETPTPFDCCPKSGSRLFKGIASKYRANQHQPVRARRFQKRCLQVDFNGALEKGETITKVTWECYSPWVTFMQGGCISLDGKRVCVDVTLNYSGIGDVKATVETTRGSVENYEFSITVTDAPMYPSAQYIPSNGPYKIMVNV